MEKNNRGLLITLIVLLSFIAVLLSGILVFSMSSNAQSFLPLKTKTICDESYSTEEISNISIDSAAGDIVVRTSKDGNIRLVAEGINENSVETDTSGDTLNISSHETNHKWNFFNFNSHNIGTEIILYIPKDFNALDIKLNFGDVEIENELNTRLTVENNMGDIDAKVLGGAFNLHTDMGDIEINRINITENSSATTSMGDIEIEKADGVNINAKTSMGNCDVKNNTPSSSIILTAETTMGNVEIND